MNTISISQFIVGSAGAVLLLTSAVTPALALGDTGIRAGSHDQPVHREMTRAEVDKAMAQVIRKAERPEVRKALVDFASSADLDAKRALLDGRRSITIRRVHTAAASMGVTGPAMPKCHMHYGCHIKIHCHAPGIFGGDACDEPTIDCPPEVEVCG